MHGTLLRNTGMDCESLLLGVIMPECGLALELGTDWVSSISNPLQVDRLLGLARNAIVIRSCSYSGVEPIRELLHNKT